MHVRLHKARAHRSRTVRCPRSSSDHKSGWRSGDLIRRLLVATEEARHEQRTRRERPLRSSFYLTVEGAAVSRHFASRAYTFGAAPVQRIALGHRPGRFEASTMPTYPQDREKRPRGTTCEALTSRPTTTASRSTSATTHSPQRFTCSPAPPSTRHKRKSSRSSPQGHCSSKPPPAPWPALTTARWPRPRRQKRTTRDSLRRHSALRSARPHTTRRSRQLGGCANIVRRCALHARTRSFSRITSREYSPTRRFSEVTRKRCPRSSSPRYTANR